MKRAKLDPQELRDWMRNNWQLYSSDTVDGNRLQLYSNNLAEFRVIFDEKILYEGSKVERAIEVYDMPLDFILKNLRSR